MAPSQEWALWKQRHHDWRDEHVSHVIAFDLVLEVLLATIPELSSKLDSLATGVSAIRAELETLKNQPPPVATQGDLDALAAKIDTIQAAITA